MYSLLDHGAMIADTVRIDAYLRALEQSVTPESCVLDVGSGSGIFALMAAKLGARRVFAIEPDDIIGLARRLVRDNGFADRITLIQADAREVTLEERADVIVSDLGGHVPWHGNHLSVIDHARTHFLAPGGIMIPAADRIFAAVVSSNNVGQRAVWWEAPHGLDLSAAAEPAATEFRAHRFEPGELLSDAMPVAVLDYRASLETDFEQQIAFDITRGGPACGIALWFDRDLSEAIRIENGPTAVASQGGRRIYSQLLFPWPKDVDVTTGDSARVLIRATQSGADYDWSWDSLIRKIAGGNIQGLRFQQSAASIPENGADPSALKLSDEGKAFRLCLGLMKAGANNAHIADALMREYPERYPRRDTALAHVAALCREYA
ncbi:MAG TPA: 50S ribosomal protein L11 methyltransferase [Gammaproteobacteria bacterium]|nr:50S ribosomal protein L11 methyltransferase [Gammaproteobacteria bacterium]